MTPTRVPIVLAALQLSEGGTERQLTEIVKSLDRARWDPRVAVLRPGGVREAEVVSSGIPIRHFPFPSFTRPGVLWAGLRFRKWLRREKIRLVHSFDVPGTMFTVPFARLAGVPVVLSSQRGDRMLVLPSHLRWLRWTDNWVDGVVYNCGYIGRKLIAEEHLPQQKLRLCYNGLDTSRFFPAPSQRADAVRDAAFVVGTVCALRAEKGLRTLVEGYAQMRREPGSRLLIVGSGPEKDDLQSLAAVRGIARECVFVPTQTDVVPWLRSMDVFVLPSDNEALSNSLMEAMGCGVSAVATKIGGNPELVQHGETGLLFERGDAAGLASALEALVGNTGFRQRLGAAASGRIHREFSLRRSVERMESIYEEFLGRQCATHGQRSEG